MMLYNISLIALYKCVNIGTDIAYLYSTIKFYNFLGER